MSMIIDRAGSKWVGRIVIKGQMCQIKSNNVVKIVKYAKQHGFKPELRRMG